MSREVVVDIYGENKENPDKFLRRSRVRYRQPIEIHVDGRVVYSDFKQEQPNL